MRSAYSSLVLFAFACLTLGCECFTPTLRIPLNARSAAKFQTRPLRIVPRASLSDGYYSLAATATNLLLAFDSEGSKVDRLYNGVPATGAVEVRRSMFQCFVGYWSEKVRGLFANDTFAYFQAPMWALPVFAVAISLFLAIAVPLLLKPGADAFNDQRNDIGIFSDKNHPYK